MSNCIEEHKLIVCTKLLDNSDQGRFCFAKSTGLCYRGLGKLENQTVFKYPKCVLNVNQITSFFITFGTFYKGTRRSSKNKFEWRQKECWRNFSSLITKKPKGVFATAIIQDKDKFGKLVTIRVLIDTGKDEFLKWQQNSSFHVKNAGQMYLEEFLSLRQSILLYKLGLNIVSHTIWLHLPWKKS